MSCTEPKATTPLPSGQAWVPMQAPAYRPEQVPPAAQ